MPTWRKFDLIWLRIELFVFIAAVCNNCVFFVEPSAEIDELTALTAERHEFSISVRPDRLVASRTAW
jgi:hypothetical protein